jgi:WD40 repeat protein
MRQPAKSCSARYIANSDSDWFHEAKYSQDGSIIILITDKHGDRHATAQLWDAASGRQISVMRGHAEQIFEADLAAGGHRLATAADDGTIRLWDAATGAQLTELRVGSATRPHFAFSPGGSRFLAMFYDEYRRIAETRLVDAESGKELPAPEGQISSARTAFSPDGRLLLTIAGRAARLWDLKTGAAVLTLIGDPSEVKAAAFSPDGSRLLTAGAEKGVAVWTIEPAAVLRGFRGHTGMIRTATVSPNGTRLLTSSDDKTARLWRFDTGEALLTLQGHDDAVTDAEFSFDGQRIVTASADKTGRVWDTATGRAVFMLSGHKNRVNSAKFSPDGLRIVTASSDKTARVWDAGTGRQLFVIEHPARVWSAVFSPDGVQIATSSIERESGVSARIFSASDGKPLKELKMFVDNPRLKPDWNVLLRMQEHTMRAEVLVRLGTKPPTVSYSPDGKRIATATFGSLVELWESDTGLKTGGIPLDSNAWSLSYSPDGTRVIVASNDGVARMFTAVDLLAGSGGPIATFGTHLGAVHAASYTPDGAHVVTGSEDQIARLWDAPRCQALIDAARHDLPRHLDTTERLRYFLTEAQLNSEARIFAVIRGALPFLLPRAGDVCN